MTGAPGGEHQGVGESQRALLAVGRLTRPVGLKGEMALELLADNRERLESLDRTWVGEKPEGARLHHMEHVRFTRQSVVIKLSEVDSRSKAETYRGQYLFVDQADSPGRTPGSYYVHEVVGLDIVDESGVHIGTITDVQKFPAQDLWIVRRGNSEIMIPAVSEFVRSVDLESRRVVVRVIEGLLDEN